jgi:hypothetical protein
MNKEIEHLLELEKDLGSNYIEQSLGYQPDTDEYGLTETEFLVLRMLVSNGESLIQEHLYENTNPTELDELLWKYLDAAIEKLPKEDTITVVYRMTGDSYFTKSDVGKEVVFPAYMTASKIRLSTNLNCEYEIRLAGRTKAKSVYKVYEVVPVLPEYQVEFPRNTKFFVEDIINDNGKTLVKLWELPDNIWPAEKLTNNITDFFRNITAIDIQDAVKKGLNPQIQLMTTREGKVINACSSSDGNVYVSPTFAQAFWNLCYIGLWLSDYKIVTEELAANKISLDMVCHEIDKSGSTDTRGLYLKALHDAYNWEDLLIKTTFLLQNQYTTSDDQFYSNINMLDELVKRVSGLYMTGMGCILLHELTHYYKDHHVRRFTENIKDLEKEADDWAFNSILSLTGDIKTTAILGGIASLLLPFYMNPQLKSKTNYYREDIRLFTQYDKISGKDKTKACIFVANVLSSWLERYHNRTIVVKRDHEEETVEEIRKVLNGL